VCPVYFDLWPSLALLLLVYLLVELAGVLVWVMWWTVGAGLVMVDVLANY
jgi:hypothetical protein